MKKLTALLLVFVLACSLNFAAFATGEQSGTVTLTAVVPEGSYTIHIPADMTLQYGSTEEQKIGELSVSAVSNVSGKICCKVSGTPLQKGSDKIAVTYKAGLTGGDIMSDQPLLYEEDGLKLYTSSDGSYTSWDIAAQVKSWDGAVPGTYTATVTFNFAIY